jgi:hypothetical protein
MNYGNQDNTDAYRRGVVLGFTVAEIILLILFALLLALATLLLSGRDATQKANAINHRFADALLLLEKGDKEAFIKQVTQALSDEIDYQKKLEDIEKKLRTQSLPDDVFEEIRTAKIDLETEDGKKQFLDLLSKAIAAREAAAKDSGLLEKEFAAVCQAGSELREALGKDSDPKKVLTSLKDLKGREDYWRAQAAKCGLAGNLPPCYKEVNEDPTPFLYDARIKETGIVLFSTIPEKYRERFLIDFPNQPPLGRALSDAEFREQTQKFLVFGNKNQCRFYVTVFDELGNDKQRLKEAMKSIEANFYKRITW